MTNNIRNVVILSALLEWKINGFLAPASLSKKKNYLKKKRERKEKLEANERKEECEETIDIRLF